MPTLANLVKNIDPPVEITQAEYNALPEEQKHDGTEYYITDGSSSFQIAATTPAEASDGTGSNVQVELDKRLEISKIMNGPATDSGYALDARYANIINSLSTEVDSLFTKIEKLDYIKLSNNEDDYSGTSTAGKYGIVYGLVQNGMQISFDVSWIRLQFRIGGSSPNGLMVRSKYGSSAFGDWLPLPSSYTGLESGTLATETYGILVYTYNPLTKVATISWKGNNVTATSGPHTFSIPEKLKPLYSSVIMVLKSSATTSAYMEVRQDNSVVVNIPAETWTGGTVTYLTV